MLKKNEFDIFRLALGCWSFHYAKRVLESIFVHRFSHGTMPFKNLFRNCGYYWGFATYVAFHVNHPLYTSPSAVYVWVGFAIFAVCILKKYTKQINESVCFRFPN